MSEETYDFPQELPEELWKILAEKAAHEFGLSLVFQPGSNPHLHIHVHVKAGSSMSTSKGDEFNDQSSGATGAKAFGKSATAKNVGNVIHHVATSTPSPDLIPLLVKLTNLLASVQTPNPAPADDARANLAIISEAAKKQPVDTKKLRGAWTNVKGWIHDALAVGLFAANSADEVQELISRITKLIK